MPETPIDSNNYNDDEKRVLASYLCGESSSKIEVLRAAYPTEVDRLTISKVELVEHWLVEKRYLWCNIEQAKNDRSMGKTDPIGNYLWVFDEFGKWFMTQVFTLHEERHGKSRGSHSGIHIPWTGQTRKEGGHRDE